MDLQRSLITSLVDNDALNQVKRSGITEAYFEDSDCKQVFAYIERHYSEFKKVPSRGAVKESFPNFHFVELHEPIEFYIDRFKETFRVGVLEEGLIEVNSVYNKDTKVAEERLRELLKELSSTQQSFKDLDVAETAGERSDLYDERKTGGTKGILSEWSKIDYETLGWHQGDFIVLLAPKWSGKSWLLTWLAERAMLQGERVLFVTQEMTAEEVADRFDSVYAGVSYDGVRRGELSNIEEERFKLALGRLSQTEAGRGSLTIARQGLATISDIEQKAVEVDATIVFIDSVYLFDATRASGRAGQGNEVQRRMAISQHCKRTAQELGVPVIVTTQAGRRAKKSEPSLDNIEWSNAFSQDANVVIELTRDDLDKELNQAWLHLLKCRQGNATSTAINMDFVFMKFTEKLDAQSVPSFDTFTEAEEAESQNLWTSQPT